MMTSEFRLTGGEDDVCPPNNLIREIVPLADLGLKALFLESSHQAALRLFVDIVMLLDQVEVRPALHQQILNLGFRELRVAGTFKFVSTKKVSILWTGLG